MRAALYIGATGMKSLSDGMNVVANNLANVSTIGFKQQDIQFADIWYSQQANIGDWWNAQQGSCVALGQKGHGVLVNDVRTIFQQGSLESSNTLTDMAINGAGYFQVQDAQGREYYTRAGDFRPDNEGVWRNPEGLALMGWKLENGQQGALGQVQVDKYAVMPAKATTAMSMRFNVSQGQDNASSGENPYFALLSHYDGTATPAISNTVSSYNQGITLYGADGKAHSATIFFDAAPSANPGSVVEYVITADADGNGAQAGPVMAGTLTFGTSGQLMDMSAYTPATAPSGEGPYALDLADWTPADLSADGLPLMQFNGSSVSVDLGIRASGGWENAGGTAADVGASQAALVSMGRGAAVGVGATTNYIGSSPMSYDPQQDGYGEGYLTNLGIQRDGTVVGQFSNGQRESFWQIPVCRFTSEYNLRREGNNLFSYNSECGQMTMGVAGTENFGTIEAYNIENSNVDMAAEMVDMIITQRGFQSNSKVVTTADEMLRKAMELKR